MKLSMDNLKALRMVQRRVSRQVIVKDEFTTALTRVAGIDVAFINNLAITACVVTSLLHNKIINQTTLVRKLTVPYIPSFLCFREGPPIIALLKTLQENPDVVIINSHGLAHPIYCGCASYVGVLTKEVTIGVAANNLCGEYKREPEKEGDAVAMYFQGRQVGWVFKSQKGCKPIYVSPGHKIGFNLCLELIKMTIQNHKFPEPLWLAHQLANKEKRRLKPTK